MYGSRESAESAGLSLAETIASKSPIAVQGSKVNLVYARDNTVDNALEYAVSQCVCVEIVWYRIAGNFRMVEIFV